MAHTPGPWSIKDGARTFYIHGSEDKYIIAEAHRDYADPQRESNARLIAAAPETAAERDRLKAINAELLTALKNLNHMGGDERGGYCICPRNNGSAPNEKHATSCADARNAIANAEPSSQ